MKQSYYSHRLTGETLTLIEIYDSFDEKRVLFKDEEDQEHDESLEEFEELVDETILTS
jgi:hypothetical protein